MNVSDKPSAEAQNLTWHLSERILFRFSFCYIILYYVPNVLRAVPGTAQLLNWFARSWIQLVYEIAGVQAPSHSTGSGDTLSAYIQQLVILILALVIGLTWSIFDRRRGSYIRLHGWLRVLARYALAFALLSYAFSKIIPTQFIHLQNSQLVETYGGSSPMGLLWRFMGYSTPYTFFAGCAELLPALLLLFRRTALLGSLIAFAVMLNVVMLNFCYDVPVKLYSLNLLLLSTFLILPDASRLFRIFVLNASTQPSNLSEPVLTRNSVRRTALVLKFTVLTILLVQTVASSVSRYREVASQTPPRAYPLTTRGFHWIQEYPYNR
jgi:hypothetical protein